MRPSGDPHHRASLRGAVLVAAGARIAVLAMALAACASLPPPAKGGSQATHDAGSTLLGPWPESGCFQVELIGADCYRFVLDDMEYPAALGAGEVAVTVHAVDIGALTPQPPRLPRDSRLAFSAEGKASGAFVITLTLVDGEGRRSESTRLDRICD